jgi:hypothetical protein
VIADALASCSSVSTITGAVIDQSLSDGDSLQNHRQSGYPFRPECVRIAQPCDLDVRTALGRDGRLTDIIHLDGGRDEFSDEQLEKWIASFPIEAPRNDCSPLKTT